MARGRAAPALRLILDPDVALAAAAAGPALQTPAEAMAAALAAAGSIAVAVTAAELADAAAEPDAADDGRLVCADGPVRWTLEAEALGRLGELGERLILTPYPVALRLGLERTGRRPDGAWVCVERAGPAVWVSAWQGARALQWRRLPMGPDIAAEVVRTLRAAPETAGGEVEVLTTDPELAAALEGEGLAVRALPGGSPALAGLEAVPGELRIWLPEVVEALELERRRRRVRAGRAAAIAAACLAFGAAVWVELERLAAVEALGRAQQRLALAAEERARLAADRAAAARRRVNAAAIRLGRRALLGPEADLQECELALDGVQWRLRCQSRSWAASRALAARLGPGAQGPAPQLAAGEHLWAVLAAAEAPWIGSFSP